MRQIDLFIVCLLGAALFSDAAGRPPRQAPDQPNILFILADDQTREGVGAFGHEVKPPNLDRLAESGVRFMHAYNMGAWNGAVCIASRSMFNTGRTVWRAHALENQLREWKKEHEQQPLPTLGKSWSRLLSDAGYKTYFSGKWHVKLFDLQAVFDVVGTVRPGMPHQTPEGYNRPLDKNDKTWLPWDTSRGGFWEGGPHWSEVLRDETVGFIEQAAQEEDPCFMYIAFNAPHDPRQSPKEYIDLYPPDSVKVPENFLPEFFQCLENKSQPLPGRDGGMKSQ